MMVDFLLLLSKPDYRAGRRGRGEPGLPLVFLSNCDNGKRKRKRMGGKGEEGERAPSLHPRRLYREKKNVEGGREGRNEIYATFSLSTTKFAHHSGLEK